MNQTTYFIKIRISRRLLIFLKVLKALMLKKEKQNKEQYIKIYSTCFILYFINLSFISF